MPIECISGSCCCELKPFTCQWFSCGFDCFPLLQPTWNCLETTFVTHTVPHSPPVISTHSYLTSPTTNYHSLSATHYPPPTSYHTTHSYLTSPTHYPLPTTHYPPLTTHHPPHPSAIAQTTQPLYPFTICVIFLRKSGLQSRSWEERTESVLYTV